MTRQRSEGSTIGMRIQSFDPSSVRKGGNFPIIKPLNLRMTSAVIRCWSHVFRRPMLDSQHSRPIPTFRLKNRRTFSQITINRNVVIDLNVRRNQPQCSNVALNIRTRQSHCGSCRSKDGMCQGTNGNSSYIFSAEKCTFIIKYSKVWKWCRTFSANFFDLNVRHLTCLRSFCVELSGQLPFVGVELKKTDTVASV